MLLVFLAFAYLFVGLAHTVSCTDEVIGFGTSAKVDAASDDGSDGEGSKKLLLASHHCPICAPALMPSALQHREPPVRLARLPLPILNRHAAEHRRLDTPPPKHSI